MNQTQLIALILSAPFAIALTSIIRRLSERADGTPRLDGPPLVWSTNIGLAVLGNVLLAIVTGPVTAAAIAWAVGVGLGTGVMGCGLVNEAKNVAEKGGTAKTVQVVVADPSIVARDAVALDVIPAPPPLPIIRDTDPMPPGG